MKKIIAFLLAFTIVISAAVAIFSIDAVNYSLPIIENFDNVSKITDTAFTTKAQVKNITSSKAIEGTKSLLLQNRSANNISVLKMDESKVALEPDKDYVVSFFYKIEKASDMNQMKFILGNRYLHWDCTTLNIIGGDDSLKSAVSMKNDSGMVAFEIGFHTAADNSEKVWELQGAIASTGPLKIMFDQIIVREKSAAATQPSVDFEDNVYSLKTDTVYYSNATIQSITTNNPISGEKSLLIQNSASQFLKFLALDDSKFALAADTNYVLQFNYRLDKAEDVTGMQLVLGQGDKRRYVRWDCSTNEAYEGNSSLRGGCKITASSDGKYVTATFRFKTAADGSETTFCIEGDILGQTPIKIVIDDIELYVNTDVKEYTPNEKFESASSLDDTAYSSHMNSVSVVEKNAISGKKSLLLQNGVNDFANIIELDTYKYALKPDTYYVFSFAYRLEKPEDMTAMQFATSEQYSRWDCDSKAIYEGSPDMVANSSLRYNESTGVAVFKVRFKTNANGTEDSFRLQGDIFGVGPTKIMIDDISLSETTADVEFTADENFEKPASLENMSYYSFGDISLVSGKNALSGSNSVLVSANKSGWTEAFSLSTDCVKLKRQTKYEYSFLCKTENIDALQFQIEGMYNVRYLRFNPKTKTLLAGDYYAFDLKSKDVGNGISKITISFKTNERDEKMKIYVNSSSGKAKLYLDDIVLKSN